MHTPIIGPALCCCGWSGTLRAAAPCPNCERPHGSRMTRARLDLLRAFAANPSAPRNPSALTSLVSLGLLRASGPPPTPSEVTRKPVPRRPYSPTPAGLRVLEVADRVAAEQARHDVAASVVRHAGLEEP